MPGDEEPQPQPEQHRLRFHVLGPVRADRDGQPLPLGSPQERATLAVLLLRDGRSLTASELVDALWGDDPPHRAMDTLRAYVTRLRAVLEPGRPFRGRAKVLVSTGGGYAVRVPPGSLDATVFEEHLAAAAGARAAGDPAGAYTRLTTALALWEGTALAGLTGPYAERERERLTELRATAREDHFDCALALGRHSESVAGLRALTAEQPLREKPRALLMLALHRAGRQSEALAVFSETGRLLPEGPGPELVRLRERILAGDPALAAPGAAPAADVRGAGAGAPVLVSAVPDRLPPEPAGFTGRETLTTEVREALAAGDVVVLTGPGGAGKTALAVHTARAVRAAYPDGLLYADLRGTDTALVDLLYALGVTDAALPGGVERRAALYRSLLADRRVLVVLDDAHDPAQVLPLLPCAPGCAALVTTRSRDLGPGLDLPGVRTVDVGAMEEKEALALLTAAGGGRAVASAVAGGDAARAVVGACARLPLALRIAGALLTTPPAWPPSDLAARLAEERQRLDTLHADASCTDARPDADRPGDPQAGADLALETVCRVAHDALEPEAARAFRLLALPDAGPLDDDSAAAVLDLPENARAEAVTGGLTRAGLLESPAPGRHGHHALVRLFARRQSERTDSPPVRDAALLRLLDHQLATAVTALLRLNPDSPLPRHLLHHLATAGRPLADGGAARAWTHDAHARVLATVRQVLAQDVPGALRPAVDLLTVWADLTADTARRQDLEPPARQALDRAREQGDDTAAARTLRLLAAPRPGPDGLDRAAHDLREALRLAEGAHDPLTPLLAGYELGVVLLELDRADEALPLLVRAEEGLGREGSTGAAAEALAHAARAYIALGRPEESLAAADTAAERARELGHGRTLALVLLQTGRAHLRADRTSAAADRLREALAVEPEGTAPRREALVWAWLARCRLAQLRHREAVAAADRALALEAGPGDDRVRGLALAARGRAQLALGEPRLALGALREAYEVLARGGAAEAAEVASLLDEVFPVGGRGRGGADGPFRG
ncbi:AfsR/SARP family transcriptional regulator [Streptomyces hesseae]|uniref:BTAD domain-containing putative transcriptional regulator n=1 Tax=Streptomyces hesseae TaxID=3075519 RepID=A0ABU2SWP8_9ACTN|nr:BTAD domain-containing putative transcriptional regulator [Streptomyces sp. DSM 40473]MDT0453366.1 BTAD domain-containing putative transcriptional regulator [Streptomyces sp. DSM 40473]